MQITQTDLIITLLNSLGSGNNTERYVAKGFVELCRIEAENRLRAFANANGFLCTLLDVIQRPDVNFSSQCVVCLFL